MIHQTLPDGITIVDYTPALAATIATMWNESEADWGGFDEPYTERRILDEENNSQDLHVYVAMDGDKAVGYCGFSPYNNDPQALYIRLLTAHSQYHGKGIGKALVLQCVKRTIELGYPRLDIHTWSGNTEAVPLYKKCGYLYENRTDSTHLVNFIPTVLSTPLFEPFFEKADWYADSTRSLEIKPDGVTVNGFELFGYTWKKAAETLAVGFERTGRQIRLIETQDYRIEMLPEAHELAFDMNHRCQFVLTNKTGKPLSVQIKGETQDNIQADFTFEQSVSDTVKLCADFFVGPVDTVQDTYAVHACVMAQVTINGQTVPMGLGIKSKPPIQLELANGLTLPRPGVPHTSYLNLTNNLNKACTVVVSLPDNERIHVEQTTATIDLPAMGKGSLPLTTTILSMGHVQLAIPCELRYQDTQGNDTSLHVSAKLHVVNRDMTHCFAYQDDDAHRFVCGPWQLQLFKHYMPELYLNKSNLVLDHLLHGQFNVFSLSAPAVGKPYSEETTHLTPTVAHCFEAGGVSLTIAYDSQARPGLTVTRHVQLTSAGLLTASYTLTNHSDRPQQNFSVQAVMSLPLHRNTHYGMDGAVYQTTDKFNFGLENLNREAFETMGENWLFEATPRLPLGTFGFSWGKGLTPSIKWGDAFYFDQEITTLAPGDIFTSASVEMAFGLFKTAQQYRDYVLQRNDSCQARTVANLSVQVNGGNPVMSSGSLDVQLMSARSQSASGELVITSQPDFVATETLLFSQRGGDDSAVDVPTPTEQQAHPQTTLNLLTPPTKGLGLLHTQLNLSYSHETHPRALLFPTGTVAQSLSRTVHTVDNGVIQFKADPQFGASLFSLVSHDTHRDWLYTNYPDKGPHAWWNPFIGGLTTRPGSATMTIQDQTKRTVDFVTYRDQHGNLWQGVAITATYDTEPKLKGITWVSYFVTLPGVPVLASFSQCTNHTGHYQSLETETFMLPRDMVGIKAQCLNGKQHQLRLTGDSFFLELNNFTQLTHATGHHMHIVSKSEPGKTFIEQDSKACLFFNLGQIHVASNTDILTRPTFYILSDTELPAQAFTDLADLNFTTTKQGAL